MSVYAVTGKLGNGKSLICVQRIEETILSGRKVATNIDLHLSAMLKPTNRTSNIVRLPDKPTLLDLESIGQGYDGHSHDESKFGLLVLDELGTWFNSRTWNDKSRQPLIDWFLHARKLRWHVLFIVQNEEIIDKQLRESLFEHIVHCRRLDRMKIPVVTPLTSMLGFPVRFPKVHIGVVQYMLSQSSLIVDRWYSFGERCYPFYDTQQVFSPNYDKGAYCLLPPGYYPKPPRTKWNLRNLMRLTKIQGKRYLRPAIIVSVFVVGLLVGGHYLDSSYCNTLVSDDCQSLPPVATVAQAAEPVPAKPLSDSLKPSSLFSSDDSRKQGIDFSEYLDPFDALSSNSDYVQFLGLRSTAGDKYFGFLVFYPSKQRFNLKDVQSMGWTLHNSPAGMFLSRADKLVTVYWMDSPSSSPARAAGASPSGISL